MFVKRIKNGITYYTSPLFDRLGIPHAFCTRYGGVSGGVFNSLNVSTARKDALGFADSAENVAENYRRALSVLGVLPENACAAKQVHGDKVLTATENDGGKGVNGGSSVMDDCDGVIVPTGGKILAAGVKTADCVPILMKNIRTGDVCAVHAGWRGTALDIGVKAAKKLSGGDMTSVVAAIGPCIGRCCYEVGEEVRTSFEMLFRSKDMSYDMNMIFTLMPTCSMGGSLYLDLARANKELLVLSGVPEENIDVSGICTCCFKDNGDNPFFSHRAYGGHSGTFFSGVSV